MSNNLPNEKIAEIKKLAEKGYSLMAITMLANVSYTAAKKHGGIPTSKNMSVKITHAMYRTMDRMLEEGYTVSYISEELGISMSPISNYLAHKRKYCIERDELDSLIKMSLESRSPILKLEELTQIYNVSWLRSIIREYKLRHSLINDNMNTNKGLETDTNRLEELVMLLITLNYDMITIRERTMCDYSFIRRTFNKYKKEYEELYDMDINLLTADEINRAYHYNEIYDKFFECMYNRVVDITTLCYDLGLNGWNKLNSIMLFMGVDIKIERDKVYKELVNETIEYSSRYDKPDVFVANRLRCNPSWAKQLIKNYKDKAIKQSL